MASENKKIFPDGIIVDKINKIYHISDVHIRNLQRHKEYIQVFETLYTFIRKHGTEHAVILLAGDIAQSKIEISPEFVETTSTFFNKLAELCPLIITPGNHDFNMNNRDRLDAISPIVNAINNDRIQLISESGIYRIAKDTDLIVWSLFDTNWIQATESNAKTKILTYHGIVTGCKSDEGIELQGKVTMSDLIGFDIVALGDIHKQQWLDNKNKIGYSSSLIQQNHGEDYFNHGLIVWDLEQKNGTFHKIENEYGFRTIHVTDGAINWLDDVPKYVRIQIKFHGIIPDLHSIMSEIRTKYKPIHLTINKSSRGSTNRTNILESEVVLDIHNPDTQNKLIKEYVDANLTVNNEIVEDIFKLNNELNGEVKVKENKALGTYWNIKELWFSNMFIYDNDNHINFSNFNGIYGLFAPNQSGKSSILNVISFALFGKCPKGNKTNNIVNVNNNTKDFYCKILIDIDGRDYIIDRTGVYQEKKNNHKVLVNFKEITDVDEIILNGDDRNDTNSIIQSYIGSYDNFLMTAFSAQAKYNTFIEKTQSERKNVLTSFIGIDILEKLYTLSQLKSRDLNTLLKNTNKDTTLDLITVKSEENTEFLEVMEYNTSVITKTQAEIDSINKKISIEKKKIKPINTLINIDKVKNDIINITKNITFNSDKSKKIQEKIQELTNKKLELELMLTGITLIDINNGIKLYTDANNKLSILNKELSTLNNKLNVANDKIKKLTDLEYDEDCTYCMNNVFVKDAIQTKNTITDLTESIRIKEDEINIVTQDITKYSDYNTHLTNYNELERVIQDIELNNTTNNTLLDIIDKLNRELDLNNKSIIEYDLIKSNVEQNKIIEGIISQLTNELTNLTTTIETNTKENFRIETEINYNKKLIDDYNKELLHIKELEDKALVISIYQQAIGRDGIQNDIMKKIVPYIEQEVNDILTQFTDFTISIDMTDTDIDIYLNVGEKKLSIDVYCGMEMFIVSVALRVALTNISNKAKPLFLLLDEGFGGLDSTHIGNIPTVINQIKNNFSWILLVSHIDTIKDVAEHSIFIQNNDTYSHVEYEEN